MVRGTGIESVTADESAPSVQVWGIYAALRERERKACAEPDPRAMYRLHSGGWYCTTQGVVCAHEPLPTHRSELLDALKVGKAVRAQGRDLRGLRLPEVPLNRSQAFRWFQFDADDTVHHRGLRSSSYEPSRP